MNISVDDFGWSNGYWRFRTCWCWPSYGSGSGSLQFAFFAILVTARYPRPIFNFNVGVLRWTWRVMSHAFSPAATDRYPPFTLHERGQYPARLSIEYPERLSRGLVLVKWWLLAIPHYLIIGMFTSGIVVWPADPEASQPSVHIGGGLIGILVVIALIGLLFTGKYLSGVFAFLMGLLRWTFRVLAYAALMRDEYPPFRLDLGGSEPFRKPDDSRESSSSPSVML